MLVQSNIKGASLMVGCMAAYAANDAFMKVAFEEVPFFQAIFLRGAVTIVLLIVITGWRGEFHFRTSNKNKIFLTLRLCGEVGATICFLGALAHMPLANATAIIQSVPFGITVGAMLFFNESVGWRRWTAIFIGFLGVLMIVQPGTDGFDIWSLSALFAVVLIVLRDLVTLHLAAEMPATFISLITAIMLTSVAGIITFTVGWEPVSFLNYLLLFTAASILIFGYVFSVMAIQVGELNFTSLFRYSILIFSIFLGMVVFDEYPDRITLLGCSIIIIAGAYTIHRERHTHHNEV